MNPSSRFGVVARIALNGWQLGDRVTVSLGLVLSRDSDVFTKILTGSSRGFILRGGHSRLS